MDDILNHNVVASEVNCLLFRPARAEQMTSRIEHCDKGISVELRRCPYCTERFCASNDIG